MKKLIILITIILAILTLYSREFVFLQELEHGTVDGHRMFGPLIHDFDRDGNDELIMWSFMSSEDPDSAYLYFYEYKYDYYLELIKTNKYKGFLWTAGIGDCDSDGLYEILGGDPDSQFLYLMEQTDSFDYPDSIIWRSPDTFTSFYSMMITNKLKPDSVDRIIGLGIPEYSTTTYSKGFYYYECAGNDTFYMKTYKESLRNSGCFDVDDIDSNGLSDIAMSMDINTVYRFESFDSSADSFVIKDTVNQRADNLLLIEDTDGDSVKELLIQSTKTIGGGTHRYGYFLYEDDNGNGSLDSIWATEIEVANNNDAIFGGDIDYGDIDGDGAYEFVICGGRHFEVWKASSNNSYYKIFEWTNPKFSTTQSHIRCHDFNKNGIDEVIYSGSGTYVGDEATFIFECRPLPKLDYNNPYDLGDKPISTNITDSLYLRAIDELPVVIDSLKLLKQRNITLNEPSYPCSVPAYDSLPITFDIYSDTSTFITDTLIVYSNDWYGSIDTIELSAGVGARIVLDSAVAYDNRNEQTGIDYDDCVKLYFNYPIDPPDTSTVNLDSILPLSNNHTWYDGTGNIKQINYLEDNTIMTIWFTTDSLLPTVIVEDTIKPDSITIQDRHHYSYLTNNTIITGSFGPSGINSYPTIDHKPSTIDLTFNSIQIENNTDKTYTYQITDITGGVIKNIEAKKGITRYTPDKSGIYFILDNNNNVLGKSIIVR
ncbi:MAG: hypothetical protein SVK54_08770 [candidate division WOR-3 bacterium]|nr:hypothetical protein [candidate division WOR-3 bacterium]